MTRRRTHGVSFRMRPITLASLALCGCLDVPRMPEAAGDAGVDAAATQSGGGGGGGVVAIPGGSGGEGGLTADNDVGKPGGSAGSGGVLVDSGVPGPGGAGGAGGTPTDGAVRWDQFNWDDGALWVE